jgi:Flp pilus assembly protein TadD
LPGAGGAMTRSSEPNSVNPPAAESAEGTAAQAYETAIAWHRKGRHGAAERLLREALATSPGNVELWNARGVVMRAMKRAGESVLCFRQALALAPDRPSIWSNLGNALNDLKHTDSAIACHERAIDLAPRDPGAYHNLGIALATAGRHAEAIAALDRALALRPDNHAARWDRARNHLHIGDFRRGWQEYEARLMAGLLPERRVPGQRWMGEPYAGKRLLIVGEQGFGDAIWIARYLRQVKALGGELVMECRPELIPLIDGMKIIDQLVPKRDPLPPADLHIFQCSLPGLFTSSLAAIPAAPYLAPDAERMARLAPRLAAGREGLRVGIIWSGSTTFAGNHDRAVPLEEMLQWLALPGVQLYSLQKGPPEGAAKALPPGAPLIDLAPLLRDFADTAAAIAQLDLVIMSDSAVAHLTGALGKPVWVLLNHVPHWLWLLDRTDSPWYPSMRLFRQPSWGDWTRVFDQAAAELLRWLAMIGPDRRL